MKSTLSQKGATGPGFEAVGNAAATKPAIHVQSAQSDVSESLDTRGLSS